MKKSILTTGVGTLLLSVALLAAPVSAASPNGMWKTAKGTFIKAYSCGGGLGLKVTSGSDNGTVLTCGAMPSGTNKWSGDLFNPEDGKTYQGHAELKGNKLHLQGCVLGIFCKTRVFTKAN